MKEFFPFIVAGLVTGSVYGLAATGLVLTYRTSGIFNFAHGAVAALGAYSFYQLRQQWGVPWPIAAAAVIVVAGAVLGYGLEGLARGLAGTGTAAKVVATIGVLTAMGLPHATRTHSCRPMCSPSGASMSGSIRSSSF
jgi:branched-subunit amino acid ABC-type transport system permease component